MQKKTISRLLAVSIVLGSLSTVVSGCGGDKVQAVQPAVVDTPITPQLTVTHRDHTLSGSGQNKIVFVGDQVAADSSGKGYLVFRADGIYKYLIHNSDLHVKTILSDGNSVTLDHADFVYPAADSTYLVYSVPLNGQTSIARIDTNYNVLDESIVSVGNTYKQTYYLGNTTKAKVKIPPALDLQNHSFAPNIVLEVQDKQVKFKKVEVNSNQVVITAGIIYKQDVQLQNSKAALSFKNRGDIVTQDFGDQFFAGIEKDVPFTFTIPNVSLSKGDQAIRFTWQGLTASINLNSGKEVTNTKEILLNMPILPSQQDMEDPERPSLQNHDDFFSDNTFVFKASVASSMDSTTNAYTQSLLPYDVTTGNKPAVNH